MILSRISIENFRGLEKLEIEPSSSTCIIGKNNAGKSSVLLALDMAMNGQKPATRDFYHNANCIVVEMTFDEVADDDLARLVDEHREKIRALVFHGSISLQYVAHKEERPTLNALQHFPQDEALRNADSLVTGKRGAELKTFIVEHYPKYAGQLEAVQNVTQFRAAIKEIITQLPAAEMVSGFAPLTTGMPNSITQLLPEIIYVPAVKDLSEETRTKETAAFGKLMKLILVQIENSEQFIKFQEAFTGLNKLLNRIPEEAEDNRIDDLSWIEGTLQKYLSEHFAEAGVSIRIGSPELKQVLSNAQIFVNDGVETPIEQKGDGIKRAMLFSLIRTYVDLQRKVRAKDQAGNPEQKIRPSLFLFEEPELFLYPSAQHKLFSAICDLTSLGHQVIITTHSPIFLRPGATTNFIKLNKTFQEGVLKTRALALDLENNVSAKNAFKLICYENNAVALFADKVLLVEGDTDQAYLPGIAKCLNPDWDFDQPGIAIVQTGGKHSVKTFRDFFNSFEVKTYVVVDADALADGYNRLGLPAELSKACGDFQELLDKYQPEEDPQKLSGKQARNFFDKYTWADKHNRLMELCTAIQAGHTPSDDDVNFLESLTIEQAISAKRLAILDRGYEQNKLDDLFHQLRQAGVAILSHGAVEAYYPPGEITGSGKPERALSAVEIASNLRPLELPQTTINGKPECELSAIFKQFFAL